MVKFIKVLLLIAFLSGQAALLYGEEDSSIRFDRISSDQGLSQSVITSIIQDHQGFMWIGTQNGLNRFDGYSFKVFKQDPKVPSSLTHNWVTAIFEDSAHQVWVGTESGGVDCFSPDKNGFIHFRLSRNKNSLPEYVPGINAIKAIVEDHDGKLWIGSQGGGLLCLNPKTKKWEKHILHEPGKSDSLCSNRIRVLYKDHQGIIWIGTYEGLSTYDPKNGKFVTFLNRADDDGSLIHNNVVAICEDKKRNIWIGTSQGLDRYDRKTGVFHHYLHEPDRPDSLIHNRIRTIAEDKKGNLWIGTYAAGLDKLKSLEEKTFIHYHNQPGNPYSLSHNRILCILADRTNIIWIGTYEGGISRIDPQKQHFEHYYRTSNQPGSLSSNSIASLCEDSNGMLWIGTTAKGLNIYDPVKKKFKVYTRGPRGSGSLSNNDVSAIIEDKNKTIWVGTWGGGLNRYDPKTDGFIIYSLKAKGERTSSQSIFCLSEGQGNKLWIGTWRGGLKCLHTDTGKISYYKTSSASNSISSNSITSICPDPEDQNILWLGTYDRGLDRFNLTANKFTNYRHVTGSKEKGKLNCLSNNTVNSLYISPTSPETLWIATYGGGLNKFNKRTGKWQLYTESDGLISTSIYGILEDDDNNLWISTAAGISRFNPENDTFKNYTSEDGLQSNEFSSGAFAKGASGKLYFGGINGFNSFFPTNIIDNPHIPPVFITSFKIHQNEVTNLGKPISKVEELVRSYKDTLISFEFAALNYTSTAKNQYKYQLEGESDEWNTLGTKRDITFTSLDPGEYVLRVQGSNNDGLWNEKGASLKITVTPPFWKTMWFKIIIVIALLSIIYIIYQVRVKQLEAQKRYLETEVAKRTREISEQKGIIEKTNEELNISYLELKKSESNLKELNATKDKFFSIISHDLRNPLTALLGTSTLLADNFELITDEKKQKYIKSINRSADHLYELLENLLQWARSQTDGLQCKPAKINIGTIIDDTVALLNINAKKKKIKLLSQVEAKTFAFADKNMFTTVLRNLVSNAIKFTDKEGEVKIITEDNGSRLEISIIDNGVGIAPENAEKLFKIGSNYSTQGTAKEKGTGLGLILCKEFIEKNNGDIWYESAGTKSDGTGKGSIFKFTVPKPTK